ncbi:MAG: stage V sporulation protein D [Patescibacteria group bacterium]|nr:MAG: stage V sporulation protein D [Patescibacteria group bacterium]
MRSNSSLSRTWFLYGGIFLFAGILITKLFLIQIVNGELYSEKAHRQYVVPSRNIFDRGAIFFTERNGKPVSAATLKSGFTIAVNPSRLESANEAFDSLSKVIPLDSDAFFIRASKKDDPYEEIAKRVDEKSGLEIAELGVEGVITVRDKWRFYPAGSTASQLLGFVGYRGDTLSGRYGLEQYYDDILSRDPDRPYVNFFAEVFSNVGDSFLKGGNSREGSIITSIEPSVQGVLENSLAAIMEEWNSEAAGGVVIDPKNGEIYALASLPDFNPNYFSVVDDPSVFSNPIVESVFEMGSIIKPLTMAAGLDAGAVTADTEYEDKGYLLVDGARIENYDGKGRGVVSMQQVLNKSLNTGAAFVMEQMGKKTFKKYMLLFGMGDETGIDLPNETAGLVGNLDSKRDIEYVTASFGQGIALTPIATVRALSALGNGGTLITPHIVRKVDYKLGFSKTMVQNEQESVIRPETSEEITRMLVAVVDDALLGGTVKLENYSIAAKTGTAQIAREDGRGYDKDRFLHSFFGYFPAYDPQFLVFLYTINPRGARYASETLTYPFMDITKFLLNYYEVPPDR